MKVALVHDYLTQYGGAERVLEEMHAIWPDAPVYTAVHDPGRMPESYRTWDIRPSRLNRIPLARRKHQALLFWLPHAFESFDLSGYDLVLSSSSGFAHGVLTPPTAVHVCYCHSPPRFLWDFHGYARKEGLRGLPRLAVESSLPRLRVWDRVAAERADAWIATSRVVQARIAGFYGKPSEILPPPVKLERFTVGEGRGGYFLMLMRLVGWKRPEIVVEACSRLGAPLVVAGGGREASRLAALAGPSVQFVGPVNDAQMRRLYRDCRALILPSEEDFGITPLEAMASGRPVLAYRAGGVLDTVVPGVTGEFFEEQTAESLAAAIERFDDQRFDPNAIRRHVAQYDSPGFAEHLRRLVERRLQARRGSAAQPFEAISSPRPAAAVAGLAPSLGDA